MPWLSSPFAITQPKNRPTIVPRIPPITDVITLS